MKMGKLVDDNTALVDKPNRPAGAWRINLGWTSTWQLQEQLSTEQAVLQSLEECKGSKSLLENEELLWKLQNGTMQPKGHTSPHHPLPVTSELGLPSPAPACLIQMTFLEPEADWQVSAGRPRPQLHRLP